MYKIWPMGCKKCKDENHIEQLINDPQYAGQVKIDGVRCILHFDKDGNVRFTTRGSSVEDPYRPIEITHRLVHLSTPCPGLADSIFDGELYNPNYTSAEVSGMISYKSTVDVDRGITLNIFDCLRVNGCTIINDPWHLRMTYLKRAEAILESMRFIVVPFVLSPDDKRNLFHRELEEGREGMVLKNIYAKYTVGKDKCMKPSNVWYKAKKHDTLDVLITGSELPEHFYRFPQTNEPDLTRETKPWVNGWFGSITFTFTDEDGQQHTGACSGISDFTREHMSDGCLHILPKYIGRWMEVEYMEKTSDGNLRHPRFIRVREEIEK